MSIENNSVPLKEYLAKLTPLQRIREYCFVCMGWNRTGPKPVKMVRECDQVICPLHACRMGKNPNHPMSRYKRHLDSLKKHSFSSG